MYMMMGIGMDMKLMNVSMVIKVNETVIEDAMLMNAKIVILKSR